MAGRVAHIEFLNNGVKTRIADRGTGINEAISGAHAGCRIDLVQMTVRRSRGAGGVGDARLAARRS